MTVSVLRGGVDVVRGNIAADHDDSCQLLNLDAAVNGLHRNAPLLSAAGPLAIWQMRLMYALVVFLPALLALLVFGHLAPLAACLALPFAMIVVVRMAALWHLVVKPVATPAAPTLSDDALPNYALLVPLFREANVVPTLVEAMRAIDYPSEKLSIYVITEASDMATREALIAAGVPKSMHVLTVPAGQPQTKPRALNYALQFTDSELIAVFDAEDVPDPNQLRRAAEYFEHHNADIVCLQARLSIYNPDDGFLTRQFTLEYAVLFEAILPALNRLGLPMLLAGTSNHFRRVALIEAGGWDAFNVTEDADLGVRLARQGRNVAMLDSDTWEEAPRTWATWLGQRTRWLKGWMQTYLVHMRQPRQLLQDLGPWRFFGVQVLLGGMILSALVHPWFYLASLFNILSGRPALPEGGSLWQLCWFNLAAGYAIGVLLALVAAWRSQGRVRLVSALLVPVYWLAISLASYRAILEFYRRPFHWEKTPHSGRQVTPLPLRS